MKINFRKSMKVLCAFFLGLLVIFFGVFMAFYAKQQSSDVYLGTLEYIESGAIPDESADFARKADLMAEDAPANVPLGVYKNFSVNNGIQYDTVLLLKKDSAFEFAMTVGNGQLHKTYKYSGRWWVEGGVFKTILVDGDLFLASPKARDRMTAMREIILKSEGDELVLLAHYNKEPVVFKRIGEVD